MAKKLTSADVAKQLKARGLKASSTAELEELTRMMNEDAAQQESQAANRRFFEEINAPVQREREQIRTGRAAKLTDRELAEEWAAQKRRGDLNPAWDGDGWKVLTKRQQAGFARQEQGKAQAAIDFIRRSHGMAGRPAKRKKER